MKTSLVSSIPETTPFQPKAYWHWVYPKESTLQVYTLNTLSLLLGQVKRLAPPQVEHTLAGERSTYRLRIYGVDVCLVVDGLTDIMTPMPQLRGLPQLYVQFRDDAVSALWATEADSVTLTRALELAARQANFPFIYERDKPIRQDGHDLSGFGTPRHEATHWLGSVTVSGDKHVAIMMDVFRSLADS